MDDLHNRTALVTGASQGLGREIARALARAGARLGEQADCLLADLQPRRFDERL